MITGAPNSVEQNQTTNIATIVPSTAGGSITLTPTGGTGTLSLVQVNGSPEVIYTAPTFVPTSTMDTVSFYVTEDGVNAPFTTSVQLDAGPSITPRPIIALDAGQTEVVGTVTPGLSGDTLSLAGTTSAGGTLSLGLVTNGTQQVIYAAPASIPANTTDAISYTISDQHNDAMASDSVAVPLNGTPAPTIPTPTTVSPGPNSAPSTPTTPGPNSAPKANAWGDIHLITFDGLLYDFQAAGEFVVAASTLPGDTYQIQARLQPLQTGSSVSFMTQAAASVGTDRVTFDVTRPDTVWIDGSAATLSAASPIIDLNGGVLQETSSDQYNVTWNTGETLTVTDYGTNLGISTQLGPSDGPGSVEGLLGSDTGAANDFQLADGTVISQPLTTAQLYGEFADAWRVTQASSLLDYGPGQTTATFTDQNFPGQPATLSNLPASVVAQAAQAVAAAGITDPNIAAAAELDYAETNDPTYISGAINAAQLNPTTTPAAIITSPASTPVTNNGDGLNGDLVSLTSYEPDLTSADATGTSTAVVDPSTPTFSSATGGNYISLAISGDSMTFLFPLDYEGGTINSGAFVGYVLTDLGANAGNIVGATLTDTNLTGLSASDLGFTPDSISLNLAGLTLPTNTQGFVQIGVDFANQTAAASSSLIAHAAT